jgi:tRNA threonylcarbamoyladenosine biosynthesis protein TsaB
MLILSLDSAGPSCSACVWRDGVVLAQVVEHMERGQDQRMMPLLLDLMQQAKIEFSDLDRIAVTRGPGSFTGLRIGLAAARGIGLAANKPVIGIDRFSIFREQAQQLGKDLLVVINSKRKELYAQYYPADGSVPEPCMMTEDEIADYVKDKPGIIIAGDRQSKGNEAITCALLASRATVGEASTLPRPLYIRPPDVTVKTAQKTA